jgi:hypothetical protein
MMGKRVLLVEGPDDEHVVKHICGQRNLGEIDDIIPCESKQQLLEDIGPRLKISADQIATLGIIVDADENMQATWQSLIDRLKTAGYQNIPSAPDSNGTVIAGPPTASDTLPLPKIGIWLMPDNTVPGILEDFLRFLILQDDALLAHVETAIASIPPEQLRFTEFKRPKALIHTWLAWQKEPGKPFGQAITARYLDANLPIANVFANWLQRTFFS